MSVEKINDCVLIPHHSDWSEKFQWSRKWDTQIAAGVTSAEDRSQATPTSYQKISYKTLAISLQERARLTARVLEALKTGRACGPFWARQSITTGGTLGLGVPFGFGLTLENPYWKWQAGDYVFFTTQTPTGFENRSIYLNGGGPTVSGYESDLIYFDTGASITTGAAIDRSPIAEPPPQVVYQSARVSTGIMFMSVGGFNPGLPCRVHLHWAQIDHAINLGANRQKFKVDIIGVDRTSIALVEVLQTAGAYDTAIAFSAVVTPDKDGMIQIEFTPILGGNNTASINAVEIHQKVYEVIQLTEGTDATQIAFVGHRLLGYWPVGTTVYPLLFGRLSIGNMDALTTRHANCKLTIEEPVGTGTVGVPGTCPAEVCYPDPPFDGELRVLPYDSNNPPNCPMGILIFDPTYDANGDFDVTGHDLGHGGTEVPPGDDLSFMLSKATQAFGQAGLVASGNILYWTINPNGFGTYWQSGAAMNGTWIVTLGGSHVSVEIVYCST
jgi:hypothetical protein